MCFQNNKTQDIQTLKRRFAEIAARNKTQNHWCYDSPGAFITARVNVTWNPVKPDHSEELDESYLGYIFNAEKIEWGNYWFNRYNTRMWKSATSQLSDHNFTYMSSIVMDWFSITPSSVVNTSAKSSLKMAE